MGFEGVTRIRYGRLAGGPGQLRYSPYPPGRGEGTQ
jgi:hypothetical protein